MLKKISQNGLLQILNVGLPFITIPWYVNKLGVGGYGYIGAALAVMQILQLLVDYGFTLTAARDIAQSDTNLIDSSRLFADITAIKICVFFLEVIIIFAVIHLLKIQSQLENLIVIGLLLVLGQALTPNWLFLGRHAAEKCLILTIIPKILVLPIIFFFVRTENDLNIAMFLNVITYLITGVLCIFSALKNKFIQLEKPDLTRIKKELRNAYPLFKSSAATSITALLTPIIINSTVGPQALGVFLIADKIRQGIQSIHTPVSMVVYPKISEEFLKSKEMALYTIKKIGFNLLIVSFVITIVVCIFSSEILTAIFGNKAVEAVDTLRVLMLVTNLTFCNAILNTYIMLPFGFEHYYSKIVVYVAVLYLLLMWPLLIYYSHVGASIAILISELALLIMLVKYLSKKSLDSNMSDVKDSILYRVFTSKNLIY